MVKRKVNVKGTEIVLFLKEKKNYISLTDIARYKDSKRSEEYVSELVGSRD